MHRLLGLQQQGAPVQQLLPALDAAAARLRQSEAAELSQTDHAAAALPAQQASGPELQTEAAAADIQQVSPVWHLLHSACSKTEWCLAHLHVEECALPCQ